MLAPQKIGAERILFYTLWCLLILGVGIWRFWPNTARIPQSKPMRLTVSDELKTFFDDATLLGEGASQYILEFHVRDDYRAKLSVPISLSIHASYRGETSKLFDQRAACELSPEKSTTLLTLPNPERLSPREIEFSLAR